MKELEELIRAKTLIKATLSNPRKNKEPKKVTIRRLSIKGQDVFQISTYFSKKILHSNVSDEDCEKMIKEWLHEEFRQGLFSTKEGDYQVLVSKKQKITILKQSLSQTVEIGHDKQKDYLLKEGSPIPFLVELGIMNPEGKVYPSKWNKFRQLNRFLEMVEDTIPSLDQTKKLSIIDFGCGKSYLTFALYHYLTDLKGLSVSIRGLDLKEDVVHFCQGVAERLAYPGLSFAVGDINDQTEMSKVDMVIALHACDTATDAAIEKAVRWKADVILVVPCCQHELYSQVNSTLLAPLLKHGILKERFAALATDAARAQLLTLLGYSAQVLEFIETEHTPKNLLIRATRNVLTQDRTKQREEYLLFKKTLGIEPSLEKRFEKELLLAGS